MMAAAMARSCCGISRWQKSEASSMSALTARWSSPAPPAIRPGPLERQPQLLLEARTDRMATTRQRADHDPVPRGEFGQHASRHMAQPAGHSMPLNGGAHRLPDDKTDLGCVGHRVVDPQRVHDKVGLDGPNPLTDRLPELSGPRHPVLSRKHRAKSRVESRSKRVTALATPPSHDGPASARAHPQPETVHTRTAAVVGLKGPLALGHGYISSIKALHLHPTPTRGHPLGVDTGTVRTIMRLACEPRRGTCATRSQPYRHVRATVRGY
jgi:hypothetical protein